MNIRIIKIEKEYLFLENFIEWKETIYNNKKYFTFIINKKIICNKRDLIEYKCDKCSYQETIHIANYRVKKNKNLCKKCSLSLEQKENSFVRINKMKENNLKKYGVEFNSQRRSIKEKISKSKLNKSKTENMLIHEKKEKTLKIKYNKTWKDLRHNGFKKKYGVENPGQLKFVLDKQKQTKLERYGNENYTNIEKQKQTCLKKYGVENYMQTAEAQLKINNRCKWIEYNGQLIQGSFELLVAKFLTENNIKWIAHKGISGIKYFDKNKKQKYYFPDFYLPEYDIYLEPHSRYYWDDNFEYKILECINNGKNIIVFDEFFDINNILRKIVQWR